MESSSGPVQMPTVEDLRARARHYRAMSTHVTDPQSLKAILELAAELDRKADALQEGESSTTVPQSQPSRHSVELLKRDLAQQCSGFSCAPAHFRGIHQRTIRNQKMLQSYNFR